MREESCETEKNEGVPNQRHDPVLPGDTAHNPCDGRVADLKGGHIVQIMKKVAGNRLEILLVIICIIYPQVGIVNSEAYKKDADAVGQKKGDAVEPYLGDPELCCGSAAGSRDMKFGFSSEIGERQGRYEKQNAAV